VDLGLSGLWDCLSALDFFCFILWDLIVFVASVAAWMYRATSYE
jgi:hypothetical protein